MTRKNEDNKMQRLRRLAPLLLLAILIAPLTTAYNAKALSLDDITDDIWNAIKSAATDIWNSIKSGVGDALNTFKDYLLAPFKAAIQIIQNFALSLSYQFDNIMSQYPWLVLAIAIILVVVIGMKLVGRSIL